MFKGLRFRALECVHALKEGVVLQFEGVCSKEDLVFQGAVRNKEGE